MASFIFHNVLKALSANAVTLGWGDTVHFTAVRLSVQIKNRKKKMIKSITLRKDSEKLLE